MTVFFLTRLESTVIVTVSLDEIITPCNCDCVSPDKIRIHCNYLTDETRIHCNYDCVSPDETRIHCNYDCVSPDDTRIHCNYLTDKTRIHCNYLTVFLLRRL